MVHLIAYVKHLRTSDAISETIKDAFAVGPFKARMHAAFYSVPTVIYGRNNVIMQLH